MTPETISEADWTNVAQDNAPAPALNNIDAESLEAQERERYRQDTRQRKFLAYWVVWATSAWLLVVLVVVFFQGFNLINLDASVMNVLLATTTINVLGLALCLKVCLENPNGDKTTLNNSRTPSPISLHSKPKCNAFGS